MSGGVLGHPHRVLFPAAALAAVAAVAYKAAGYGGPTELPSVGTPYWHGHEMVFGFAYAVIAGYLVTRRSAALTLALLTSWLFGRILLYLPDPAAPATAVAALSFPALLFVYAGVPFLRAARKGRNIVFAPLVAGLFIAELLYQLGALDILPGGRWRGLILGMNLISLLLFAMGGRVIAAATSGALQKLDGPRPGVAHPHLDRAGVLTLGGVALLDAFGIAPLISAALGFAAGGVVLTRLVLWRVWRTAGQADLVFLHLGYGFLGLGLIYTAAMRAFGSAGQTEAMHSVMVGGLGTLAAVMMIRATLQRLRRPMVMPAAVKLSVALIAVAFFARSAALHAADPSIAVWIAGGAWVLAYLLVFMTLCASAPASRSDKG